MSFTSPECFWFFGGAPASDWLVMKPLGLKLSSCFAPRSADPSGLTEGFQARVFQAGVYWYSALKIRPSPLEKARDSVLLRSDTCVLKKKKKKKGND